MAHGIQLLDSSNLLTPIPLHYPYKDFAKMILPHYMNPYKHTQIPRKNCNPIYHLLVQLVRFPTRFPGRKLWCADKGYHILLYVSP